MSYPTFTKAGLIDLIFGANKHSKSILKDLKKAKDDLLGQNTELEWILSGNV